LKTWTGEGLVSQPVCPDSLFFFLSYLSSIEWISQYSSTASLEVLVAVDSVYKLSHDDRREIKAQAGAYKEEEKNKQIRKNRGLFINRK
jgi:hypothetical protein